MPVTGLPDRRIHRLCWNCRCWFHLHEGILDFPPVVGPLSFIASLRGRILEDEHARRFYCLPCHEKVAARAQSQRKALRWSIVMLAVMVVAAVVIYSLGLFQLH